ncbi:hypothetical protein D3C76_67480 [compost metagenome]
MPEKEERLLQQNVEEITERAGSVGDMEIYKAMRSGILEGKKRDHKRKYSYGIAAAAAAIIAAPIAFPYADNPQVREARLPVQSAAVKSWNDSKLFQSANFSDPALVSALERNIIKPIYKSAEKKGIRVEVLGAVTDGRKVFILYSVQNHSDQTVVHADFTLDYGDFKAPSIGASLEMAASSNIIEAGQTVNFAYSVTLQPSVKYPKSVKYSTVFTETSDKALASSSNKYRTSLSIPFELDPDMFKAQTKQVTVNRTLSVEGQKIKANQILYTPLATYLDLAYDEKNSKQIFQLLNPVLIGKNGDATQKMYYPGTITSANSEVYKDGSKFTLVFRNTPDKPFDTASLKIAGIAALDKNQLSITVDLHKNQIIHAPDTDLTLAEPAGKTGEGQILLSRTMKNLPFLNSTTMRLADSYTDAKGAVHPITGDNGGYTSRVTSDEEIKEGYMFSFGKKALDYPQPLTIAIERYWNPILESHSLELYSK